MFVLHCLQCRLTGDISIVGKSGGLEDDFMGELDSKNAAPEDASCGMAIRSGWILGITSVGVKSGSSDEGMAG